MKNILITMFLSGILSANLHAQVNYLPADSLLQWFENSLHPLDVWGSIRNWKENSTNITDFNYKAYYQTPSLKPHLMKWLDRGIWADLHLRKLRENLDPDYSYDSVDHKLDSLSIMYSIKGRLKKQNSPLSIDTILSTTLLFSIYKDSIIDERVAQSRKEYEKKNGAFPDNRSIYFHMNLAYPESYQQIKSFWEETGKETDSNPYFVPLVKMGDPEARAIYDELVNKTVKNNCEDHFCHDAYSDGRSALRGSYGTAKLIELLEIDQMVDLFGHGDPEDIIPYKCRIIDLLLEDIFSYNIEVDPMIKYRDPCEEDVKHLAEIKAAAQRLTEYYKDQEYYWMSNMPFYEE